MSHARGMTAIALADLPVGVDITEVAPNQLDDQIAAALFTAREKAWLATVPNSQQPTAFAHLWSLKEAVLKRDRTGLGTHDLPDFGNAIDLVGETGPPHQVIWQPMRDLKVASLAGHLTPIGLLPLGIALLAVPTATLAIAVAWTPLAIC